MSVNSKMTAIADEVRTLSGATDKLGLDDMATNTHEANAEVDTQEELIQRIKIALQSKVTGAETPTQEKTIDITENGIVEVTPDEGYALSKVTATVNVVSSGGDDSEFVAFVERTATDFQNPSIETVSQYICYNYTTLKSVDFPSLTTIGGYGFYNCTGLTALNAPSLKTIGTYVFYNCTALGSIDFSKVTSIGSYAFRQCRKLTEVCFPQATSVGSYALSRCSALTIADLGLVTSLQANVFAEDSKLHTLILRKSDGIVTLANVNALSGTAIARGTGYIYVPKTFLSDDDETMDYRRATNWSTFATQFRAIEDYPEITGGIA